MIAAAAVAAMSCASGSNRLACENPIGVVAEPAPYADAMLMGTPPPPYVMAQESYERHIEALVRTCHAMHPPTHEARVVIRADISAAGRLTALSMQRTPEIPVPLMACLETAIRSARFLDEDSLRERTFLRDTTVEVAASLDPTCARFVKSQ